jgi:hypothetical protein
MTSVTSTSVYFTFTTRAAILPWESGGNVQNGRIYEALDQILCAVPLERQASLEIPLPEESSLLLQDLQGREAQMCRGDARGEQVGSGCASNGRHAD